MATETVRIEGLKGVLAALKSLPPEIVSKRGGAVRAALRKAGKIILDEAKANVQRIIDTPNKDGRNLSTGLAVRSLRLKTVSPLNGANGEAIIVTFKPKQKYPDKTIRRKSRWTGRLGKRRDLYANDVLFMLEHGTATRPAMPWMRPAFDAKKGEALSVFVTELNKGIARAIKKAEKLAASIKG